MTAERPVADRDPDDDEAAVGTDFLEKWIALTKRVHTSVMTNDADDDSADEKFPMPKTAAGVKDSRHKHKIRRCVVEDPVGEAHSLISVRSASAFAQRLMIAETQAREISQAWNRRLEDLRRREKFAIAEGV
jgi:hypothetical protein